MKKNLFFIIALSAAFTFSACGNDNSNIESDAAQAVSTDESASTVTDTDESDESAQTKNNDTASSAPANDASVKDVSVKDVSFNDDNNAGKTGELNSIYNTISSSVSLVSPMEPTEDFIFNYYGIDVSMLNDYLFVMSEDATSAETIIILDAANEEDAASYAELLETLVSDKELELQDYLPEEYAITHDSEVVTDGNYVWLVISHNRDSIVDIIENNL